VPFWSTQLRSFGQWACLNAFHKNNAAQQTVSFPWVFGIFNKDDDNDAN